MIRINPYKGKYSLYIDGTNAGQQPPTFSVNPTISGTAVVGQTLTCDGGTVTGTEPITKSYQWYRGATLISGATNSTYTLVQADAGQNIKCTVTATNTADSVSADSNTVAILATLLDLYPNAAAAYSVRLLRGAYYGSPAIRVRRSNDNAEQDIGFTASGDLDTSALTTFVGANSGFVVTWYDQSGNAMNMTQTTPSAQFQIVNSGSLITKNGKAAPLIIDSSTGSVAQFMLMPVWHTASQSQLWSFTVNSQNIPSANGNYIMGSAPNNRGFILMFLNGLFRTGTIRSTTSIGNSAGAYTNGVTFQRTDRANRTNITTWNNGTQVINIADGNTDFNMPTNYYFGNTNAPGTTIDANYLEMVNYVVDQTSNRAGIETNQRSYYGI